MDSREPHASITRPKRAARAARRTTRIGSALAVGRGGKRRLLGDGGQERERAQEARAAAAAPCSHGAARLAARHHAHRVAALEVVGGQRRGDARWRARGRPWPARRGTPRRRAAPLSRKMRDAARGFVLVLAHHACGRLRAVERQWMSRGSSPSRYSRRPWNSPRRPLLPARFFAERRARAAAAARPSGASCRKDDDLGRSARRGATCGTARRETWSTRRKRGEGVAPAARKGVAVGGVLQAPGGELEEVALLVERPARRRDPRPRWRTRAGAACRS